MFLFALGRGAGDDVLGFGCETDEQRTIARGDPALAELGEDIGRLLEHQRHRVAALRHLLRRPRRWRVIGHRRRHDDDLHALGPREHGPIHLFGTADAHHLVHRGRVDRGRTCHEGHVRPAPRGLAGDGKTHSAARPVAEISHRIEIFVSRTGGDEHPAAAQRPLGSKHRFGGRHDIVGLSKATFADPATGQIALAGLDKPHASRRQRVEISANRLVGEHLCVHGRRDEHRRTGRDVEGRKKIVRDAVGDLADDIGRGGCNDQQIDRRRDRDVLDVGIGARLELIRDHAPFCDRLECDGTDKSRRRRGHHRDDLVAALLQAARDLDRLVGADAAGHSEGNQHLVIW